MKRIESLLEWYHGKRILITGNTGFKGTWMTQILLSAGAEITGYALQPSTEPSLFQILEMEGRENLTQVYGDIRDLDSLKDVFKRTQPEVVFHLAAQPIVLEAFENPVDTYSTNVMGTVNVCECVRQTESVKSFLNITTDKVYKQNHDNKPYIESCPLDGSDPYSNSKSCSELVTHSYDDSYFDIAASTVRAGNVIGGGDFAPNRIIPDCIRAVLDAKKRGLQEGQVVIRNSESIRPYQHVLDPIFAYILIAKEQFVDSSKSGCYNIGPEEDSQITTGNLAKLFLKEWNNARNENNLLPELKISYKQGRNAPHESDYLTLDCSLAKETFNWRPVWGIDRAIKETIRFTLEWINGNNVLKEMDREIQSYIKDYADGSNATPDTVDAVSLKIQQRLMGNSSIKNRSYLCICIAVFFCACTLWYCMGRDKMEWIQIRYLPGYDTYCDGVYSMLAIILWLPALKFIKEKVVDKTVSSINNHLSDPFMKRSAPYYLIHPRIKYNITAAVGFVYIVFIYKWMYCKVEEITLSKAIIGLSLVLFFIPIVAYVRFFCKEDIRKSFICGSFAGYCGCIFYIYITLLAEDGIDKLTRLSERIDMNTLFTIIELMIIHILCAIVGYAVYRTYETFRLFYHHKIEERIDYPIRNISRMENYLKRIREVFLVYAMSSIIAYCHIYYTAYLFSINKNKLTLILLWVASICPLLMLVGVSYLHRKLCHNIYVIQMERSGIEHTLSCLSQTDESSIDMNRLNYYIHIRDDYIKTLDIDKYADLKYYIIALIPPLINIIPELIKN